MIAHNNDVKIALQKRGEYDLLIFRNDAQAQAYIHDHHISNAKRAADARGRLAHVENLRRYIPESDTWEAETHDELIAELFNAREDWIEMMQDISQEQELPF